MARLLILDDDPVCQRLLASFLEEDGHQVASFKSGDAALDHARGWEPDVFLTDWQLKEARDGVDIARELHGLWPNARIVFMTGLPADHLERNLGDLPVMMILEKPLDVDELFQAIRARL